MSGQIILKGTLQVRTPDGKNVFTEPVDLTKTVQEYDIRRIKIAPGSVDTPIEFAGVSDVSFLYIQSDKPVSLKINGALVDTSQGNYFLFTGSSESSIASVTCSNAGVEIATLLIVIG